MQKHALYCVPIVWHLSDHSLYIDRGFAKEGLASQEAGGAADETELWRDANYHSQPFIILKNDKSFFPTAIYHIPTAVV